MDCCARHPRTRPARYRKTLLKGDSGNVMAVDDVKGVSGSCACAEKETWHARVKQEALRRVDRLVIDSFQLAHLSVFLFEFSEHDSDVHEYERQVLVALNKPAPRDGRNSPGNAAKLGALSTGVDGLSHQARPSEKHTRTHTNTHV